MTRSRPSAWLFLVGVGCASAPAPLPKRLEELWGRSLGIGVVAVARVQVDAGCGGSEDFVDNPEVGYARLLPEALLEGIRREGHFASVERNDFSPDGRLRSLELGGERSDWWVPLEGTKTSSGAEVSLVVAGARVTCRPSLGRGAPIEATHELWFVFWDNRRGHLLSHGKVFEIASLRDPTTPRGSMVLSAPNLESWRGPLVQLGRRIVRP